MNGQPEKNVQTGAFHTIDREWRAGDRIDLVFPMPVALEHGFNGGVTITRGPLVYSLKIGEDWRKLRDKSPAADWEVLPTTPWNYAVLPRTASPAEHAIGEFPFSPEGAPVSLAVKARRLPKWKLESGSAAPPPQNPVKSSETIESVILIPYGSAKLRVTVFPELAR